MTQTLFFEAGCSSLEKIYECKKCGAHHSASDWEDTTFKVSQITVQRYTILYCPSCEQASTSQEIDFLSNGFDARFWPYSIDKNEILDQYPEMIKWL